jgi:hypothetical protein
MLSLQQAFLQQAFWSSLHDSLWACVPVRMNAYSQKLVVEGP